MRKSSIVDKGFRSATQLILLGAALSLAEAEAGFTLNFLPDADTDPNVQTVVNNATDTRTCIPGVTNQNGDCSMKNYNYPDYDTYFVYEIVTDDANNVYHHIVVGQEADGFAQDAYVKQGASTYSYMDFPKAANMPDGGGFAGGFKVNTFDPNDAYTCMELAGAMGCNPLWDDPVLQGGASENPNKTLVRQVATDAANGFSAEFLQDIQGFKPKITQQLVFADAQRGDISLDFKADMRAIDFNTIDTLLTTSSDFNADFVFVNKLSITATNLDAGFDQATDADKPHLTAGQFTFTAGVGWVEIGTIDPNTGQPYQTYANRYGLDAYGYGAYPIYQPGYYTYGEGNFDHTKIKVKRDYFDSTQNICGGDPFCPVLYSDPSNVDLYDPAAPTTDTAAPDLPAVVNP